MKRGIDHLVLCVSDFESAAAFYRQLGFNTTPRAEHPWGTDNSLIQLKNSFLELLTVTRPERVPPAKETVFSFGAYNMDFLSRREGMSMLVFESTDARADREEFTARGLLPFENFHFERLATLPDGDQVTVAFTLAFAVDQAMPETVFFCCQQHAPQYFWQPAYQTHKNGADGIDEVIMVAPEPHRLVPFFSKIQEPDAVAEKNGGLTVSTPRGIIQIDNPNQVQKRYGSLDLTRFPDTPFFLGFAVHVPDLETVEAILQSNQVSYHQDSESIYIAPENAYGVLIEFRS